MKHFQVATANKSQETQFNNTSLSAINALALAENLPWEDSFRLLLAQGKRYGLLLTERKCWENMLISAGYVRIRGFHRLMQPDSYAALSAFLSESYPCISRAVVLTSAGAMRRVRCCAVRKLPGPGAGFVAMDIREEPREIFALWLHYTEIGAPKPEPDLPQMCQDPPKLSHKGFLYYQPNPLKNAIGDCVIRAYSAVFDQSWEETLDMLAKSCEYKNTRLNSVFIYQSLASEYEFDPHSRLVEQGKGLTGMEFCDRMTLMCRNGERFFAKVGNDHVVGIIPTVINGEKQYAVADCWDSSSEKIGSYWVFVPKKKKPKEAPKAENKPSAPLAAGDGVIHPAFGTGIVREIQNSENRIVIHFPRHGEKMMTLSWVQSNCRKAEGKENTSHSFAIHNDG